MQVVEKFISINGEGYKAGQLATFVRFKGCNLNCSYCDTKWANQPDCPFTEETPSQIAKYVLNTGIRNVTLTGGEPLLQPKMEDLIPRILWGDENIYIEIETNGAVPIKPFKISTTDRLSFTMDYKLPSSGCEHLMCLENFKTLTMSDSVKFVVGSLEDLERAKTIIEEYKLLKTEMSIFFSPVFGKIDPVKIVDFMKENNMNGMKLQLQMHKFIWHPDTRGVLS